jgi:hypothetical protein
MDKEYSIEDKKKILRKIEGIKNKNNIEKIKSIIMNENPELSVTKKSNGVLMFFHNLNQSTYKKLDIFFDKLDIEKINTISATFSDNNKSNSESDLYDSPKIKLSNAEKKILKKKEYQTQIEQKNNNDIYVSDDDIIYKKNIEK